MIKNKIYIFIIITILVILNFYSLYSNIKLRIYTNTLKTQYEDLKRDKVYGSIEVVTTFRHPEIVIPQNDYLLVVLFADRGCSSCYEYEVPNLNKLYQNYSSNIIVYYVGNNSMTLDDASPEFQYTQISPYYPILDTDFVLTNTTIFLLDKNSVIQQVYKAEIGNRSKSSIFYNRIASYMSSRAL